MRFFKWIASWFRKKPDFPFPTPGPVRLRPKVIKFGYIIGHTQENKGAFNYDYKLQEFDYWEAVLIPGFTYVYRYESDGGVEDQVDAAAKKLKESGCTHIIEVHFNAYNNKTRGVEALCHDLSWEFASEFTTFASKSLGHKNRGAKNVSTMKHGKPNMEAVKKYSTDSILIEPFFGDNEDDYVTIERMRQLLVEFEQHIKEKNDE